MASASTLQWMPDSLYNYSISCIVSHWKNLKHLNVTDEIHFDIYYKLYNEGRLCALGMEFSDLNLFSRMLGVAGKRNYLNHCFQALMDHGVKISKELADAYQQKCCMTTYSEDGIRGKCILLGLNLGSFLSDAGWYYDSGKVLKSCLQLCKQKNDVVNCKRALECSIRLLTVYNENCEYEAVENILRETQKFVEVLEDLGVDVNKAAIYSEQSALLFSKSLYDKAYYYSIEALKELSASIHPRTVVNVLRQGSKSCVVKREFKRAELLITFAVQCALEYFGPSHKKYSDALKDYGFFLLNVDAVAQSVIVYQSALNIRLLIFGGKNIHVAIAHEDLAYSTYVNEYSSGRFKKALEHANQALEILFQILPKDHLLSASSRRVKALILEEIAIDSSSNLKEEEMLTTAQELHLESLALAIKAFGENNVQTAKYYGNLGRLYQSMHKFDEAVEMHLKAISIKEQLLGSDDYEVALSVGHLASLYNYDMQKYKEAEELYLRSITIGCKLFGPGYSGLEYDYRGLIRLYRSIQDYGKASEYSHILTKWTKIRKMNNSIDKSPFDFTKLNNIHSVVNQFFSLSTFNSQEESIRSLHYDMTDFR